MERILEYFEYSIKSAYKSVRFNKKQFVWFFVAIFIIMSLLGIINISSDINTLNTEETVNDSFDSHYIFQYMNLEQKMYIERVADYLFRNQHILDIQKIVEYGSKDYTNYRCDIYVKFANDPESDLSRFNHKHLPELLELGTVNTSKTPLFDVNDTILRSQIIHIIFLVITSVFSLFLLSILYKIRINNFTFDYGIFITFGAHKKKLLNTAFWEMNIITLITFIPALIFSAIVDYIFAVMNDYKFVFNIISNLKILGIAFLINILSVSISVIKTSKKTPTSLISSQDNSNMIISPNRSANFLKKLTTKKPIKVSAKRYFKHYVTVIFTGVFFAVVFVGLVFCANLYKQKQNLHDPHFLVTYNNALTYTDADREAFMSIKGVTGTFKEHSTHATTIDRHILLNNDYVKPTAKLLDYSDEFSATDKVAYHYTDNEIIDYLKQKDHSGDLSSLLSDRKTVIISDSSYNKTNFDFKPGDKILIAKNIPKNEEIEPTDTEESVDTEIEPIDTEESVDTQPTPGKLEQEDITVQLHGNALLAKNINEKDYVYTEYTIGAVIHNDVSNEDIKIYINPLEYIYITEDTPSFKSVYIYTDENLPISQQDRIHKDILRYIVNQHNTEEGVPVTVENLNERLYSILEENNRFELKLNIVAYLILIMSFVVWLFSQSIFYHKRNNEFTILQTIGFTRREVRKFFIHDAFIESLYGLLTYLTLSICVCIGIFYFVNSKWFLYSFRYNFDMPYVALAVGAVSTILIANISVFISYVNYRIKNRTLIPKD